LVTQASDQYLNGKKGNKMKLPLIVQVFFLIALLISRLSADLMTDSPVKFPKEGGLPARYPPDQLATDGREIEEGYYISSSPERSLAQIKQIQAEMPQGQFSLTATDWTHLERSRRILTTGGELRILAMGDSIINDTMRSAWVALLRETYPKADIRATVYVRGGGGCQHFEEAERVAKYAAPVRPDLVLLGGISQENVDSIREVIHQLRGCLPEVEILLTSGTFGTADPRVEEEMNKAPYSGTGPYGEALKELANSERCAYLDLTTPWAAYIRSAKVHPHLFYRDVVHANEFGEQILAKILLAYWSGGG
jgi:lysophospholipase L1-like esterase